MNARLSEKIRARIWKVEYVDFGSLLANPVLADQINVNNSESSLTPPLCLEPLSKNKKVMTFETTPGADIGAAEAAAAPLSVRRRFFFCQNIQ